MVYEALFCAVFLRDQNITLQKSHQVTPAFQHWSIASRPYQNHPGAAVFPVQQGSQMASRFQADAWDIRLVRRIPLWKYAVGFQYLIRIFSSINTDEVFKGYGVLKCSADCDGDLASDDYIIYYSKILNSIFLLFHTTLQGNHGSSYEDEPWFKRTCLRADLTRN